MKTMWCWRCRADVPMLDEDEYRQVISLRGTGADGTLEEKIFGPVLKEYERITGFSEKNPNAIFHHRISDFGAPCATVASLAPVPSPEGTGDPSPARNQTLPA